VLNRFFGQKPQEEMKRNEDAEQEQPASKPTSEQRFTFLSRTRQLFGRLGNTVQETDTITDSLWMSWKSHYWGLM